MKVSFRSAAVILGSALWLSCVPAELCMGHIMPLGIPPGLSEAEAQAMDAFGDAAGIAYTASCEALGGWSLSLLPESEPSRTAVYWDEKRLEASAQGWCQDKGYAMGIFLILRRDLVPADCIPEELPEGYPGEFCPWTRLGLWEAVEGAGPIPCEG